MWTFISCKIVIYCFTSKTFYLKFTPVVELIITTIIKFSAQQFSMCLSVDASILIAIFPFHFTLFTSSAFYLLSPKEATMAHPHMAHNINKRKS